MDPCKEHLNQMADVAKVYREKLAKKQAIIDELVNAGDELYQALQAILSSCPDTELTNLVAFSVVGAKEKWNKAICKIATTE